MRFLTGGVILLLAVTLGAGAGLAGTSEKAGTASAQFLKISLGSKSAGMGGAYCGVLSDLEAIYLNPAGLAGLTDREFEGAIHEHFEGIKQGSLALALPWSQRTLGLAVIYLNAGDIEGYGSDPEASDFKQGTFDATDYALAASLAGGMISNLSYGISVKMINSKIKDDAANLAFGLDVGGLYQSSIPGLSLGFALQNIGNKLTFHEEGDDLPLSFRIGTAYNRGAMTLVSDVVKVKDSAVSLRVGGEYCFKEMIAVRGGYQREDGMDGNNNGVLTFGLGANLAQEAYQFDYAYIPYDDLNDIHRFSARIRF